MYQNYKKVNKIIEENNNSKLDMLNSDEYFIWLNKYSKKNPKIFSSVSIYSVEDIEAYNNIQNLKVLFNLINEYSSNTNINPIEYNYNNYYYFSALGTNYQIGYGLVHDNISYSCMRLDNECELDLIDIDDIRNSFKNKKIK